MFFIVNLEENQKNSLKNLVNTERKSKKLDYRQYHKKLRFAY